MRMLKLCWLILLTIVITGCCSTPTVEISPTKPPQYTFNPIPVLEPTEVPGDYLEAAETIAIYDAHVEDLTIWIEGVLQVLSDHGAEVIIP